MSAARRRFPGGRRARVVVGSLLPIDVAARLPGCDVVAPTSGVMAQAALEAAVADADAVICLLQHRIDDGFLARAPGVGIVANNAVGFDNVDVPAASARGVLVSNTPDVLTDATADLTLALLLATVRRLGEAEALLREGRWHGFDPGQLLGGDLGGRTLGLIGLGRIGRAVAARARGFGLRITYAAPHRAPAAVEAQLGARHLPLPELLASSDFVSLHCALTPTTRGLIDAAALARMQPHAILINTARGAIVDEAALAAALHAGRLGGAGLDVFTDEPRVTPALLTAPRTTLLPHIGSATMATRTRMAELCVAAITGWLTDRRPDNLVNPELWPRGV